MGINFCIQLNRIFYYFLRQTDNFISRSDNNSGDYTVVCSSYLRIVLIRRSNGSQIIVWILLYNNKTQRFHSPIYEYLDADRPPSGPCARRKPNSSNFTFLPATIRYLAAFVDIRLFTINNTKKDRKKCQRIMFLIYRSMCIPIPVVFFLRKIQLLTTNNQRKDKGICSTLI